MNIERCIHQVKTFYALDTGIPFATDYMRQDAIAMNLQCACEAAIDIANHLIKLKKLGLPQDARESFALLQQAGLITSEQMKALQAMVGFRNTLVHRYQELKLQVMVAVIECHLGELLEFANAALAAVG